MSVQLQLRHDTAANWAAVTPAQGEIVVDTTSNRPLAGDGATAGGWPVGLETRSPVADAAYTVRATDRLVAYTAITAARAVTLPASNGYPLGAVLCIADESGSCSSTLTITVIPNGSDTIDGASSALISAAYGSLWLESNSAGKWSILSANTQASTLGIGAPPSSGNALTVSGSAALFSGTNFNITVNKAVSGDTASIIFQDGYSGRAQMGLNGSDNYGFKVSPNGSSWTTAIALDATTGAATFANMRTAVSDAAYTVLTTDREVAYTSITAARVVTLPAASSYPAGQQLVIIDESGSVSATNTLTVSRAGSDTIAGQTSATLSSAYGYIRLISNGSNLWSVAGRSCNVISIAYSASPYTYKPSAGAMKVDVFLLGGGGGGGGGAVQAASTACSGGAGGGGAFKARGTFTPAQIGSSITVTIGAGGAGGAAASGGSAAAGGTGGAGGGTTFGSLMIAWSGGGGAGGQLASNSGGGSGGGFNTGGFNGSGATGGAGYGGSTSGGSGAASVSAWGTFVGVGGSGGANGAAGANGPASGPGGGGGGAGGGISAANATFAGGTGSAIASEAGEVNAAGASGAGGAAGGAGPAPSANSLASPGGGGGGGGSSLTVAGVGGAGALGSGGGGGGSSQVGETAGAGGAGGNGLAVIIEYF